MEKIKIESGGSIKEVTGVGVHNNRLVIPKKKIEECSKMIINMKKGVIGSETMPSLSGKLVPIKQTDKKSYKKLKKLADKVGISL